MTIIAIDAMGGDFGPPVTIPAAIDMLARCPQLTLILVGDETVLTRQLASYYTYDVNRLSIQHATQTVEMDESPAVALRSKKDSSMRVAINLVKEGRAQACVSAGNTGALMATARFVLKTLPGIDRPAIISAFPTIIPDKKVRMLDLGANVDSEAQNLVQFAVMASVLVSAVDNLSHPRVCLLNIGAEDIKGNELVKQTAPLLSQLPLINYAGFIEGDAIYHGTADVVVCDGFVGNVTLKASEGVAIMMGKMAKASFMRTPWTKFIGLLAKPILKAVADRVDPALYNGATLIGLQGTVIKSHGGASVRAFANAIKEAMIGVEKNIPNLIHHQVAAMLQSSPSSLNE